jgi:hypothetical protein
VLWGIPASGILLLLSTGIHGANEVRRSNFLSILWSRDQEAEEDERKLQQIGAGGKMEAKRRG